MFIVKSDGQFIVPEVDPKRVPCCVGRYWFLRYDCMPPGDDDFAGTWVLRDGHSGPQCPFVYAGSILDMTDQNFEDSVGVIREHDAEFDFDRAFSGAQRIREDQDRSGGCSIIDEFPVQDSPVA